MSLVAKSLITIILLLGSYLDVQAEGAWTSREAEPDEGSCICGLNMEILDKLDSIVQSSKAPSCSINAHTADEPDESRAEEIVQEPASVTNSSSPQSDPLDPFAKLTIQLEKLESLLTILVEQQVSGQSSGHLPDSPAAQVTTTTDPPTKKPISQSTTEANPTFSQAIIRPPPGLPSEQHTSTSTSSSIINQLGDVQSVATNAMKKPPETDVDGDKRDDISSPSEVGNDFLSGLSNSDANEALAKLNQSQSIDPSDMANALESTVPNLVSDIFSDIQNMTEQTAKNPQQATSDSNLLVSIDGSSVNVNGDSSSMIITEGERLFLLWIERQLESLHLTASMANYIRKNAVTLFRRIVKQYVARVEKLGGDLEDNVRRATQAALNYTENLTAHLLKHYLYFAAGLMQIIGEQVSRIGKQIDSTGESITKINLNPFDIVSNVLRSLPDPSRYSEYFRAFGRQIMGETTPATPVEVQDSSSAEDPSNNKRRGLLKKTMGALSKTLNSWVG